MGLDAVYLFVVYTWERYGEVFAKGFGTRAIFCSVPVLGKWSLDYLWYGIGAFLQTYPNYRYLFGPVSISNSFSKVARELFVFFYTQHFGADQGASFVNSKRPYKPPFSAYSTLSTQFSRNDILLINQAASS